MILCILVALCDNLNNVRMNEALYQCSITDVVGHQHQASKPPLSSTSCAKIPALTTMFVRLDVTSDGRRDIGWTHVQSSERAVRCDGVTITRRSHLEVQNGYFIVAI